MASQPGSSPYDSPPKPGAARTLILAACLAFLAGGGLVGWVVWYNLAGERAAPPPPATAAAVPSPSPSLATAPLIASAADGHVDCSIDTIGEIQRGQGDEADCPRLVSVLPVGDRSNGGPHWGAIDNHSRTPTGAPTRLAFSNSFVARTGVDGDHRMYVVDVDPATGALSYDRSFRDETTGTPGVEFNRRNWPNNPDAGFYKPHAMVWVCPPGVCPA